MDLLNYFPDRLEIHVFNVIDILFVFKAMSCGDHNISKCLVMNLSFCNHVECVESWSEIMYKLDTMKT